MAFLPSPFTAKVRMGGLIDGLPLSMGFHMVGSAGPSFAQLQNMVTAANAWLTSDWQATASPGCTMTTVSAQDVSVQFGQSTVTAISKAGTLGGATQPLPGCMAAKIVANHVGSGLRRPGRIYHPGLDESQTTTANELTAGAIAAMNTAYGNLLTQMNASNAGAFGMSTVSYFLNKVPRVTPAFFPVTGMTCRAKVATQVRRLRGQVPVFSVLLGESNVRTSGLHNLFATGATGVYVARDVLVTGVWNTAAYVEIGDAADMANPIWSFLTGPFGGRAVTYHWDGRQVLVNNEQYQFNSHSAAVQLKIRVSGYHLT